MLELVEYLVKQLAENREVIKIEENDGRILILLDKSDMGKVIGRQGKIIKAIRTVVRSVAPRGVRCTVDVEELPTVAE